MENVQTSPRKTPGREVKLPLCVWGDSSLCAPLLILVSNSARATHEKVISLIGSSPLTEVALIFQMFNVRCASCCNIKPTFNLVIKFLHSVDLFSCFFSSSPTSGVILTSHPDAVPPFIFSSLYSLQPSRWAASPFFFFFLTWIIHGLRGFGCEKGRGSLVQSGLVWAGCFFFYVFFFSCQLTCRTLTLVASGQQLRRILRNLQHIYSRTVISRWLNILNIYRTNSSVRMRPESK